MKYLKSTSQKAYTVNGKVIPACVTPGNKTLEVDDSEWFQISTQPVIASLIKSGDILVMDEDPNVREDIDARNQVAELKAQNTELTERIKQLEQQGDRKAAKIANAEMKTENADLKAENGDLKAKNEKLVTELEELKKQAVKELEEMKAENEKLKAEISDTTEKQK